MSRHKAWVFTLNNYSENDILALSGIIDQEFRGRKPFTYVTFQQETAGSGTEHLQGYFVLSKRQRLRWIKRNFAVFERAHLERRRGSHAQARDYAQKERTRKEHTMPYIFGEEPVHGNSGRKGKNDFTCFLEDTKKGMKWKQLMEKYPNVVGRYQSGSRNMYETFCSHRKGKPKIIVYYGPSGAGKTYTALKRYPEAYYAPWPTGGRWWWPNYQGEEVVIMNEFRHQVKMDVLLTLFDYSPMWVEGKGTNMKCQATKFIVTTNIPPHRWYPKLTIEEASMLHRRLKEFGKFYEFTVPPTGIEKDEDGDPICHYERKQLQDRQEPNVIAELFDPQYDFRRRAERHLEELMGGENVDEAIEVE